MGNETVHVVDILPNSALELEHALVNYECIGVGTVVLTRVRKSMANRKSLFERCRVEVLDRGCWSQYLMNAYISVSK